jgi:hypothetical protein
MPMAAKENDDPAEAVWCGNFLLDSDSRTM